MYLPSGHDADVTGYAVDGGSCAGGDVEFESRDEMYGMYYV